MHVRSRFLTRKFLVAHDAKVRWQSPFVNPIPTCSSRASPEYQSEPFTAASLRSQTKYTPLLASLGAPTEVAERP
jgi:hypothetical protein